MSKLVIKNISEIVFTPRKPTVIHLSLKQWSEARKDFRSGNRIPRNGSAIALIPDSEGGAYVLPYCSEAEPESEFIVKPKYDPDERALSYTCMRHGESLVEKNVKIAISKRRRRRQCNIAITTAGSPRFKCLSISCKGRCHIEAKEFKVASGKSIYLIYCVCSKG
ncbi:MAG: hypothetical protein KF784_09330 [Fimbriimonadaceae bacterium]|nr:hypothetical protein [Fimbriimonadaceae bacterium]